MRFSILLLFTIFTFGQQTSKVDFKTVTGNIILNAMDKKVSGTVNYLFEVNKAIDTIRIDAQKMIVTNVKINFCSLLSKRKNGKKKKYRKAHEVSLFDTNIIIFKLSHFQIFKLKNYLRFSK